MDVKRHCCACRQDSVFRQEGMELVGDYVRYVLVCPSCGWRVAVDVEQKREVGIMTLKEHKDLLLLALGANKALSEREEPLSFYMSENDVRAIAEGELLGMDVAAGACDRLYEAYAKAVTRILLEHGDLIFAQVDASVRGELLEAGFVIDEEEGGDTVASD